MQIGAIIEHVSDLICKYNQTSPDVYGEKDDDDEEEDR